LVLEGLNKLIDEAKKNGLFRGIQAIESIEVTHVLFVDDISLFGRGNLREQSYLKSILDLFCKATRLEINMNKYCILTNGLSDDLLRRLEKLFPMKIEPLNVGVKYLGFYLKLNGYKTDDWTWLINKMEDRITCWCNRWIYRGGRLVLVKSVLESILVYWSSIAHVPKGILDRMRKCCYSFLWTGRRAQEGIPLVKWERIARLKALGGWGIKKLYVFI
jgi:hypothetical protein